MSGINGASGTLTCRVGHAPPPRLLGQNVGMVMSHSRTHGQGQHLRDCRAARKKEPRPRQLLRTLSFWGLGYTQPNSHPNLCSRSGWDSGIWRGSQGIPPLVWDSLLSSHLQHCMGPPLSTVFPPPIPCRRSEELEKLAKRCELGPRCSKGRREVGWDGTRKACSV